MCSFDKTLDTSTRRYGWVLAPGVPSLGASIYAGSAFLAIVYSP